MNEHDMQVFLDVSTSFFETLTGERATIQSGRLEFGKSPQLDYSGIIRISGSSEGVVCLTVPQSMLAALLRAAGEEQTGETIERDMVGEAASIIASNARKHFGPHFHISVPEALSAQDSADLPLPFARLTLPIQWREHQGCLILALTEQTAPVLA